MSMKRVLGAVVGLIFTAAVNGPAWAEDVTVYAAASLTNALNDIATEYTAQSGNRVVFSYGASSALAKQVEQGAPAQIFASADLKWMDYLADKKLIDLTTRANMLGNRLVLVAPLDSPVNRVDLGPKSDIAALAGNGRIATGDPDAVPVGLYFRQTMERTNQWAAVEPKLARAESVRAALALVERGEVPFGVVYATDAAISKKVKVVGHFPDSSHDPIVYPFAMIAGHETEAAQGFFDYLHGRSAQSIFGNYGFILN